jgi:hypothetical protein
MAKIETSGGEAIAVAAHGDDPVCIAVTDPCFGRIATVRLDHRQAAQLAAALDQRLVDAAGGVPATPEA